MYEYACGKRKIVRAVNRQVIDILALYEMLHFYDFVIAIDFVENQFLIVLEVFLQTRFPTRCLTIGVHDGTRRFIRSFAKISVAQ